MRTVILGSLTALCLAAALAGCKDNEQSFYIEHMKALPELPDCEVSSGDPAIIGLGVDLALAGTGDYYGYFQTTNALVARENYDNLISESNGIFIDGAEASVEIGGAAAGGTEYRTLDQYLEAESTDVIPAITISAQSFSALSGSLSCPSLSSTVSSVRADLMADGVLDTVPTSGDVMTGTGTVQLFGHTQGDIDVETNQFSFPIHVCCGCSIDWSQCANPCTAFCTESESTATSCSLGINASESLDCAALLYNPTAEWNDPSADGGVGNCEDSCTAQ